MKLIKICLFLLTIFTANFAFAGEPAPNLPDPPKLKIIQGGGGYFPSAANDVKYGIVVTDGSKVAKIIPSVVKVASFASRASNAIGLVQLAYEGIMSGVDYVLDPANNRVIFSGNNFGKYCQYKYEQGGGCIGTLRADTIEEIISLAGFTANQCRQLSISWYCDRGYSYMFFGASGYPARSAPFSDVATNLQDKANTGNAAAQTLIDQVVQDMINKNDDEILTALKSPEAVPYNDPLAVPVTNPVKNPDGSPNPNYDPQKDPQGNPLPVTNPVKNPDGSPNPNYDPQKDPQGNPLPVTNPTTNPDGSPSSGAKPFELPAFCSWASAVCDWQQWTKDTYTDAKNAVKDGWKWITDKPELSDDSKPTIDDIPLQDPSSFDKDYINVSSQCPPDVVRQIFIGMFGSFELRYPITPICDFLSTYMKPVIIFLAYIIAGISIGNAFKVGG